MNDYSDDDNTSEEEDYDDNDGGTNAAMSLFASYYGIIDPAAEAAKANKPKGTIDDSDFDAEAYVKRLLETEPMEGLVSKDTEFVHEIRTLDGEMQKLVYDNYNKFITATETIKEMKQDVYGMDPDMESVRMKMDQIAEDSQVLDSKLQPSRIKVDKLVRVRRLLERLEFLSELPERLSAMIDEKQYKEAVKLYNKTISVLTRHSHVLSFKKIKERTELMMKDLTGKVIDLLEDSTLDAVMLTQYVSVLRLMNAPTGKVAQKLLSAHRAKSMLLIEDFATALSTGSSNNSISSVIETPKSQRSDHDIRSPGSENIQNPMLDVYNDISKARQFHQTLVVGLIEACKGIYELYHSSNNTNKAAEMTAAGSSCSFEEEYAHAYHALKKMISEVMVAYTGCLCAAFKKFFNRYEDHTLQKTLDYADLSDLKGDAEHELRALLQQFHPMGSSADKKEEDTSDQQQFQSIAVELEQEKSSWLLLARQAIVDVQFLDHNQKECFKKLSSQFTATAPNQPHPDFTSLMSGSSKLLSRNASAIVGGMRQDASNGKVSSNKLATHDEKVDDPAASHVPKFANTLLGTLKIHADTLQAHRVSCYLRSISNVVPYYRALLQVKDSCLNANKASVSSGSAAPSGFNQAANDDDGEEESASSSIQPQSAYELARESSAKRMSFGGQGSMGGSIHGIGASNAAVVEAQNDRTAVLKHTSLSEQLLKLLQRNLITCFQECAKEIKPMTEMCEISDGQEDALVLPIVARFHNLLAYGIELLTGLSNNVCQYNIFTDTMMYINSEGELTEVKDGVQQFSDRPSQKRDSGGADIAEDWADEIYVELPTPEVAMASTTISPVKSPDTKISVNRSVSVFVPLSGIYGAGIDDKPNQYMKRPVLAFLNMFLRQIIPTLMSELQQQLQQLDLPALEGHMAFQDQCYERLVITAQTLLQSFVDENVAYATSLAIAAQQSVYLNNFEKALAYSPSNDNELSAEALIAALNSDSSSSALTGEEVAQNVGPTDKAMLDLVRLLDEVTVMNCVLFRETPPKISTGSSSTTGTNSTGRRIGASSAIEKDIERIFSKRVRVLQPVVFDDAPTVFLSMMIKAALKSINEVVRAMTLPFPAYIQIQGNVTFLRQVAAGLLKESSECDPLVDQALNATFSRYLGANDITSASDSQEMALVSKAVATAYSSISHNTVLISR